MDIHGENTCYFCGTNINWIAQISESSSGMYNYGGNAVLAEAIATGSLNSSHGRKIELDIIVICPKCKNRNKFISTV